MSYGSVTLVNHMALPGDIAIVNSAKQSYGKQAKIMGRVGKVGANTGISVLGDPLTVREKKIIEFMMEHRHGTPFEGEVMSFQIRCTIKEARDWFRYRFSSYNEYSTRFSPRIEDEYIPGLGTVRTGSAANGGIPEIVTDKALVLRVQQEFIDMHLDSQRHYQNFLEMGISQELASYAYNLAQMTEFTWTVNARSLMNFLSQRMDGSALLELRKKAYQVYALAEPRIPYTLEMWTKYRQPDMMTDWNDDDMLDIPADLMEDE